MKFRYLIVVLLFCLSISAQVPDSLIPGNPSGAVTDLNQPDNYLVTHQGYALSYNRSRGTANWVAWHLEKANIGTAERTNAFAPDTTLPADWWIVPSDYSGSGYDRGHMLPSKDRSDTNTDNRVTFLMSNMQPQAPKLNQKTWKYLEDYTRQIVGKDAEGYIYAGCYGDKGRLRDKITIPTNCFKIIVVLSYGDDDLQRINTATRVIAVDMPNDESVSIRWRSYLTTVDAIEEKTGYDFLSNVSKKIQKVIEARKDSETDEPLPPPGTVPQTGDRVYQLGTRGGCYYLTDSGRKSYVDKKFCEKPSGAVNPTATSQPSDAQLSSGNDKQTVPPAKKSNSGGDREYLTGARGGCYYLTESGAKKYVDKSYCPEAEKATEEQKTALHTEEPKNKPVGKAEKTDSGSGDGSGDGRTYLKGSRGGCYYLNSSGKKVYVDKEKCRQ